jgi:hypothetical protein
MALTITTIAPRERTSGVDILAETDTDKTCSDLISYLVSKVLPPEPAADTLCGRLPPTDGQIARPLPRQLV